MFEHRTEPLLPVAAFAARVARSVGLALAVLVIPLVIGMVGYHVFFDDMPLDDSFVNAAMILSGMGPLAAPPNRAAKIFAGSYALFSGAVFVTVTGIILGPFVHRVLHRFHLERDASTN